jgi:glycerol-3-phosphate dehydrogenase (NAD(P)+)
VGHGLAAGKTAEAIQAELGQVAEGVRNAKSVRDLAKKLGIEMPITETVYRILYEGLSPRDAVTELMLRETKSEM